MATTGVEKRTTRRFALQLPVSFDKPVKYVALTRDVSSRGICFYTDTVLEPGSEIEFTMTLPSEITMTEAINVHCRGRVLRIDQDIPGKMAIAAQIHQYQFIAGDN